MFSRLRLSRVMEWWRRGRQESRARKVLRTVLSDPARIEGTSLRPVHAGRADLVEFTVDGEEFSSLTFTLLRHPRPHRFSSQHHLVAELWRIELPDGRPERVKGLNLSKLQGEEDGRPAGHP